MLNLKFYAAIIKSNIGKSQLKSLRAQDFRLAILERSRFCVKFVCLFAPDSAAGIY